MFGQHQLTTIAVNLPTMTVQVLGTFVGINAENNPMNVLFSDTWFLGDDFKIYKRISTFAEGSVTGR